MKKLACSILLIHPGSQPFQISIHAPTRGATPLDRGMRRDEQSFNSRAREGRDLVQPLRRLRQQRFNSRAREGRDISAFRPDSCRIRFNSRAREGRDILRLVSSVICCSFNSRAREGRDLARGRGDPHPCQVSIHAPARGATGIDDALGVAGCFNSRAREGRDKVAHALDMLGWFQFTRPRGARHMAGWKHGLGGMFQFTRPRGARPLIVLTVRFHSSSFNSRAREGRDIADFKSFSDATVSIHAPARGATKTGLRQL